MTDYGTALRIYLEDLAARKPAPGGGSAAALTAALGVSLLSMVAHYTLGKPDYSRYEERIRLSLEKSEKLRLEFLRLVDLDCAAYQSGNKRDSLNVPFMTARLCCEALRLCPTLVKRGNRNLASDIGVAAALLEAAFSGSWMNVEINLKMLGDKKLTLGIRKELSRKGARVRTIRKKTEDAVGALIRG